MSNWQEIQSTSDIDNIKKASHEKPSLIFKHSTSCSISRTVKDRLERNLSALGDSFELYYLDLLRFRPVSNAIATEFGIEHESPQVLIIQNGNCTYSESHFGIIADELLTKV